MNQHDLDAQRQRRRDAALAASAQRPRAWYLQDRTFLWVFGVAAVITILGAALDWW